MRCLACQVDLNENVVCCPLCGGPAEDIPPLIEGVAYQDHPSCEYRPLRRLPPITGPKHIPNALSLFRILFSTDAGRFARRNHVGENGDFINSRHL